MQKYADISVGAFENINEVVPFSVTTAFAESTNP